MDDVITTLGILREENQRTNIALQQLLLIAVKSATVRRLAKEKDFVLKGGTLLSHVYKSPRASVADIDYAHLAPGNLAPQHLDRLFSFSDRNLTVRAKFDITNGRDYSSEAAFRIEGITLRQPQRRRAGNARTETLDVTVSIRKQEVIDGSRQLEYTDRLLATNPTFVVCGLSLEEIGAEKILGWASKTLPKHFVDIAYLQREFGTTLNARRTAELLGNKFSGERGQDRYKDLGIADAADLLRQANDPQEIQRLFPAKWTPQSSGVLMSARDVGVSQSLHQAENVVALATEFLRAVEKHMRKIQPDASWDK